MEARPYYEVNREDIHLLEYSNVFVGNLSWINRGIHNDVAIYDFVVRELPKNWNYYVFYGLTRFIDILLHFKFTDEDIEIFKKMSLIDSQVSEDFYRNFHFTGDVAALKDGTIFFPGEPVVRIAAPISQANMLTAFILNAFNYPIRILTKKVRVRDSIGKRPFMDSSIVRLPGFEQGMICLETSYILGSGIIAPLFFKKFPQVVPSIPTLNINHAFIKSFKGEREAYRYALDNSVEKGSLTSVMVDTYDFKKGLQILIEELQKTPGLIHSRIQVCIDSGNLEQLSHYVRKVLDKAHLEKIGIWVMSSLDEYSIDRMVKNEAPIDSFVAGTEVVNVTDNPKLECVYKMAQVNHSNGDIEYKAKFAEGKESHPGKKQIFRIYKDGKMEKDVIGLDGEDLGNSLLHTFVKNGKIVIPPSGLDETKTFFEQELQTLPKRYRNIYQEDPYPVTISKPLSELTEEVRRVHVTQSL